MKKVSIIGVDLAKNVFQLHGAAADGTVLFRKKLSRPQFHRFISEHPQCLVAMEACGGAHYWAREMERAGHEVKLIAPRYVKPFIKRQKNDAADAEAIVEAALRPTMRYVEPKSGEQRKRPVKSAQAVAAMFQGSSSPMRVDRVIGDAGEHVGELGLGVEAVELGGLDRGRAMHGRAVAALVGAGEERVLAAEGDHPVILPMSGRKLSSTTAGILSMAELFAWNRARCARPVASSMLLRARETFSSCRPGCSIRSRAPS